MSQDAGGAALEGREQPSDGQPADHDERMPQVSRWLALAEDVIYLVVAVTLIGLAAAVVIAGASAFIDHAVEQNLREAALGLLDSVLLVLMLVEILHTVGISLREHVLVPEPFLIVGLIAAIRRILVITAEQGAPTAAEAVSFRLAMLELGLLGLLILVLVGGLIALSRWRKHGDGARRRSVLPSTGTSSDR